MTWDVKRAELADSSEEEDNNPWLAQQPEASSNRDHQFSAVEPTKSVSDSRELAENPLYHGSPTLGGPSWNSSAGQKARTPLNTEATRPSLYRLTSNSFNGLLQGFETLSFPNTSQESISTDDTGLNGSRRSLDELRKLSIKGKGSATEAESSAFDLLSATHVKSRGREALFHPVEKGDSLTSLALLYGCTVQAIRSANKLWHNDPIYLRKHLYIPLDACTQPPSKEVEFVQKSGEDEVHLYFRQPTVREVETRIKSTRGESRATLSRTSREIMPQQGNYSDLSRPLTPYHDDEASATRENPFFPSQVSIPSQDEVRLNDSNAQSSAFPSKQPYSTSHSPKQSITSEKILRIVTIPGSSKSTTLTPQAGTASRTRASSPLVSVQTLEDTATRPSPRSLLPQSDAVSVSSSTSHGTPRSSTDYLRPSNSGPANLRQRPKSPAESISDATSSGVDSLHAERQGFSRECDRSGTSLHTSPGAIRSPRLGANGNIASQSLPRSMAGYLSAGAGYVSKVLGSSGANGSGTNKWLAMDDLEEELQLAQNYQASHKYQRSSGASKPSHGFSGKLPAPRRLGNG